jgi:outer membrane protein assembly factor BamD (BamD/ComL family)
MRMPWIIFCVLAAAFSPGLAGFAQMPEAPKAAEDKGPIRVKHEESWWSRTRPEQKSAEKQLEYADSLKNAGKIRKAISVYRDLVYAWPDSAQAPVAQLNYAQLLEQKGELTKAFDEYQFLIETYPGFFHYQEVLDRQFNIADKLAARNRYFLLFRYQAPEDAIPLFEKMIQSGLQWKRSSELQFRIARIYEKTGQYDQAIDAYTEYHQRYPMGPLAEQAAFGQAKCSYLYAKNNRNAANLRENAVVTLKGFLEWYPQSDMATQARRYLKEMEMESAMLLYDQSRIYLRASNYADDEAEEKRCLAGAKISFQRLIYEFPSSRWADTARARIRQIDERLGEIK